MSEDRANSEHKNRFSGKLIMGASAGAILIALGASGYYYYQYQQAQSLLQNPVLSAQLETAKVLQKVGAIYELPKNETPAIATVSDASKLDKQPFFQKAQNGDKILIYNSNKIAILYRPSENKIIAFTGVNVASPSANVAPQQIHVALYNGTAIVGLTNSVGKTLITQYPNIVVDDKENASSKYTKTVVVDLSGGQGSLVSKIATTLNGVVGNIPSSETKPQNTDILIILGK